MKNSLSFGSLASNGAKVQSSWSQIRLSTISSVFDVYISDYPTGNICDKYVVSHVVKAIVNSGLEELSEQLKTVYSKDMVDKKICGELDTNLSVMKDLGCADLNYIETGIYPLMFLPTYLIWDNADNPDFGEQ